MSRAALVAAAVFVLGLLPAAVVWLTEERTYTASTPTARPIGPPAIVDVPAGARACLGNTLVFEPDAGAVRFQVRAGRQPGPPLELLAEAPGYRATARHPGGYRGDAPLEVPIAPAPSESPNGRLCVRNAGDRAVGLIATGESRYYAPLKMTVDDRVVEAQWSVALIDPEPASVLGRLGTVADRVTAFRPDVLAAWMVVALMLAAGIGIPALVVVALLRAR